MRIILIHPNYHSGGREIAGNWPPARVTYICGLLKAAGYTDIRFVDAMTNSLLKDVIRAIIGKEKPDIVGATAITPFIYKAERLLQIAKEAHPNVVAVLGGVHATFMYQQVLTEAPWIDAIVRGEGESIFVNLVRSVDNGTWLTDRLNTKGIAYSETRCEAAGGPFCAFESHGQKEAAAAARRVSSHGKISHDAWHCEIFLRARAALHELPDRAALLGRGGRQAL